MKEREREREREKEKEREREWQSLDTLFIALCLPKEERPKDPLAG